MSGSRLLLGVLTVGTALLVQTAVLARLPLPGGTADLVLVVVVAFALVDGPLSGTVTGFAAGLVVDLASDHEVGRLALVYALAGYLTGLLADDRRRSLLVPVLAVAAAAAGAVVVYAAEGLLVGDPRITGSAFRASLVATTAYSGAFAPLVVPLVRALVQRLDADARRR